MYHQQTKQSRWREKGFREEEGELITPRPGSLQKQIGSDKRNGKTMVILKLMVLDGSRIPRPHYDSLDWWHFYELTLVWILFFILPTSTITEVSDIFFFHSLLCFSQTEHWFHTQGGKEHHLPLAPPQYLYRKYLYRQVLSLQWTKMCTIREERYHCVIEACMRFCGETV